MSDVKRIKAPKKKRYLKIGSCRNSETSVWIIEMYFVLLVFAHAPNFDIIVGMLILSAPESRDVLRLLLLYFCTVTTCPFLNDYFVFLLETTLSDSHKLDRCVVTFTCQFCTTTSKL
jgi:hypothetical protein